MRPGRNFFRELKRMLLGLWRHVTGQAGGIGIIGGADGPTAIFMTERTEEEKKRQDDFLSLAAKKISPCAHTLAQLEEYLVQKYGAVPVELSHGQREMLKVNVILNYYPELIGPKRELPDHPSKRELLRYAREDHSFEEARAVDGEALGLSCAGYRLPEIEDAVVLLERISGYLCVEGVGAGEDLPDDLTEFMGVTKKDIEGRTPRFISYVYTLKKRGKL